MEYTTQVYDKDQYAVLHYESSTKELLIESIEITILQNGRPLLKKNFAKKRILFGASEENQIALEDAYISKHHAVIERVGNVYWLKDLKSRNGTWVGGQKISETILKGKGKFTIGQTSISYRVHVATKKVLPIKDHSFGSMIGSGKAMREVFGLIEMTAPSTAPVCITGESGTGKELVARSIHERSLAQKGSFVAVNCGAINKNLIESELFGHEKGSFTGALERKIGLFEQAHMGSLFLDEIGEMPFETQTSLLRVLETGIIRRVGGLNDISVNVRLLTATHRHLESMVASGEFREDLFYRLYVVPIKLPPLRERTEDIPILAKHFLSGFGQKDKMLTAQAGAKLAAHPWKGNIRELKNVVQRAILFSNGSDIDTELVEEILPNPLPLPHDDNSLKFHEKQAIVNAVRDAKGNFSKAAKKLGIARSTLHSKLKLYQIRKSEIR